MTEAVKINSRITMNVEPGKWIIKIGNEGFEFNRKEYPDALADDFAKAFVEILEKCYDVTMEKRVK